VDLGGDGSALAARKTVIDNVRFATLDGVPLLTNNGLPMPQAAIKMTYIGSGDGKNWVQKDEVFVYNYNQVPGDNFQVFYHEQAPTSSCSNPTFDSRGYADNVGSPVAGLSNLLSWTFSDRLGGRGRARDATTRSDRWTH